VDKKKNYYQLIPKEDLKCVWMTAGLLSYKLCKYDLQCEKCPLDWELRNLSATPSFDLVPPQGWKKINSEEARPTSPRRKERSGEDVLTEDLSRLNINGSLFYHPGHTWVKVEKVDGVRIGLDYFLGEMIGKVKVIVLPLPGGRCLQGENLCSIIQEEGILDIVFPVSGSILSVNEKLKDQPELVTKDPLGEGFLLTLKPKNLQRDQRHLFFGEAALSWYQRELERFKAAVVSELPPNQKGLGITMQDGEIKLGDIQKLIETERYIQLVSTFLRKGEKDLSRSKHERGGNSEFQVG
jgi:glycine cleavage system H protein